MIKATTLNKTIIVWEKLSDKEIAELLQYLNDIIKYYKELHTDINIPIRLFHKNEYLAISNKNGNTILFTTKNIEGLFECNPIINGDYLYESINFLKNAKNQIKEMYRKFERFGKYELITLNFTKAVKSYLLSPLINPQDFIKSLSNSNLPQMYQKFLENVGFELQNNKKINNLLDNDNLEQEERM